MYTVYKDKSKNFKCMVEVEGASIKDTQSRLVLTTENKSINLLYFGNVSESGECTVPIHKLGDLLDEDVKGKLQLEVIVDGAIFKPWESDFVVKTSKKVRVAEVNDTNGKQLKEISDKPRVNVSVVDEEQEQLKEHVNNIRKIINTFRNKANRPSIGRIIEMYESQKGLKIDRKEIKKLL